MSGITHATIRAAGLGDVEHILAEYRQAVAELPLEESANLLWRPYDEFKTAVENGLFFCYRECRGQFHGGRWRVRPARFGRKRTGDVLRKEGMERLRIADPPFANQNLRCDTGSRSG